MIQPVELLRLIRRFGRLAEPAPTPPAPEEGAGADEAFVPPRALRGSAQCRHVDVGSCNGCEVEIGQAFGPVYDADRYARGTDLQGPGGDAAGGSRGISAPGFPPG